MATRKKLSNRRKKQIYKDTWSLDYAWIEWLCERLPVYLREGGKIVDLTFYKFKDYQGVERTEEEIVKQMIDLCNWLRKNYFSDITSKDKYDELCYLWSEASQALWW